MTATDPRTLTAWIALVRLPAVFSAWSNILAGHLIGTSGEPIPGLLVLQLAITTCLYWAGMILNDCFDLEEDRLERPSRPLPAGRVSPRAAWSAGIGLLLLGLALGAVAGGQSFVVACLLALAIVAYDGWLKRGRLAPWSMGLCRYGNWMLGLSASPISWAGLLIALPVFLYTAAVTALSRNETKGGDRGALLSAAILIVLGLAVFLSLYVSGTQHFLPAGLLVFALSAVLAARLYRAWRRPTPEMVQSTVGFMLLGMIPLDAVLLLGDGQWVAAVLVMTLILPGRLLASRVKMT